jgi:CRP/FNR family transcriptional regulator, dissimilatory nitrate respiration regulator
MLTPTTLNHPLFSGFDDAQRQSIIDHSRRIHLAEGAYLFHRGERAQRFFLLQSGHITLSRISLQGDEKIFEIIKPGELFAEAIIFMPHPIYPLDSYAANTCELHGFDGQHFISLLEESFPTAKRLMASLCMRLHHWINEVENLTQQNATYRLTAWLLLQPVAAGGNLLLPFSKNMLASRLSINPETLSRLFKKLQQEGLITMHGRDIEICDRQALAKLAGIDLTCSA